MAAAVEAEVVEAAEAEVEPVAAEMFKREPEVLTRFQMEHHAGRREQTKAIVIGSLFTSLHLDRRGVPPKPISLQLFLVTYNSSEQLAIKCALNWFVTDNAPRRSRRQSRLR